MEHVISKIEDSSKEILSYWKETKNWIPEKCYEKIVIPDLNRHIQLTNFLEIWNRKNSNDNIESFYLAYALLAELTEGWIRLAYCIHFVYCKENEIEIIEPDKISFVELQKFAVGKLWQPESNIDKFVKRTIKFSEYIKKEGKGNELILMGLVVNLYTDIIIYKDLIEEIDIRLPYPNR